MLESGGDSWAGNQNEIHAGGDAIAGEAEGFSEDAFDAVSADSGAELTGDAESDPGETEGVFTGEDEEESVSRSAGALVDAFKVGRTLHLGGGWKTERLHKGSGWWIR